MADTEFITARFPDAEFVRTQTRGEMRRRVHLFIPPGNRARLRVAGNASGWGPWRRERDAVARILERTDWPGVGPKLIVQRERDMAQLSIREVTAKPDLHAQPDLEEIHWGIWEEFEVRSGGLWLCRFVDGTDSVSKQGYLGKDWKGAAEDIFPTEGGTDALADIARFTIDRTKRGVYRAATVIWLQRIWTPSGGERAYSGNPHFHDHIDVPGGVACKP